MVQGRSTKIIYMIKWIRTSRLSVKNCLSEGIIGGLAIAFRFPYPQDPSQVSTVLPTVGRSGFHSRIFFKPL
jgi:hypothetical protein